MTSANLDLVRSLYADWERGDFRSADWAHPEIEFAVGDGPETVRRKGVAAMAAGWRDFLSAWDEYRIAAEEFHELDEHRVLVLITIGGRGKASGLEVAEAQAKGANLFQLRDGQVTKLIIYSSRERAFADAGLAR